MKVKNAVKVEPVGKFALKGIRRPCPRDADGSDEQIHALLLLGEHMLDARADCRFRIVGSPRRLRHDTALRLLAMDVADEAVTDQKRLVSRRSVGGIGPDPARRIALV